MIEIERNTKETQIRASLAVLPWDRGVVVAPTGSPRRVNLDTAVPFFDHMLHAMAFHGGLELDLQARGDVAVDAHHTVEDCGIVIGRALAQYQTAHGPVARFAHAVVPMDDALAEVTLDVAGRSYLVYQAEYPQSHAGAFDLSLVREFLHGLATNAQINVHARVCYGLNGHHMVEALFKALGRALGQAYQPGGTLLSTKGLIGS